MSKIEIGVYGRNVATLTSLFCLHPVACQAIQRELDSPDTEGTLWSVFAGAAQIFTEEYLTYNRTDLEAEYYSKPGPDSDWYNAIEHFTGEFMDCVMNKGLPTDGSLRRMAWEAIGEYALA